ncbi:MAG: sulfotransferase [Gammaproteobacteria bacterium]|nr:sulfotransferase [Gammaproteobacteria bacterium]
MSANPSMSAEAPSDEGATKLAAEIRAIQADMRAGRMREGAAASERLLAQGKAPHEALYCLAVCRRYLGQGEAALAALDQLAERAPDYARGWQERGHLLRATGQPALALSAYRRAVRHNDALPACWQALAELAQETGNADLRHRALARVDYLRSLPEELIAVQSFANEGRTLLAERLCRDFLKRNPKHVEAMRLLASFGASHGIYDDAEFLLESALAFEPGNRRARIDYIDVLHKRQKYEQSLTEAQTLLDANPNDPIAQLSFANQAAAAGRFDDAIRIYDEVVAANPGASFTGPTLQLTRGHALKATGRVAEAVDAYRGAYRLRGNFGDAFWSLANLKTYRFTPDEFAQMRAVAEAPDTPEEDRIHVLFALGKAFEDAGDADGAFGFYEQGNSLRHAQHPHEGAQLSERMKLQQEVCTAAFFKAREGWGCPAPDAIFVVGLPRAGSTLIEQILASHSAIDGALEFHHIGAIAQRLDGRRRRGQAPRYPMRLTEMTADNARELGERFLADTRIQRRDAPFFIDKMPNNFRHLGLIHMILPNARVIDARRQPMACCFSNYKQLFASGQEFSYDLEAVGTYYRDYVALMEHWDRVLPGKALRVQYEEVVADLETQVRRMLDFLGLPFEEACLDYHRTERAVRTPSSEQVRQPIFREGLDQWRQFEGYLGPLRKALDG